MNGLTMALMLAVVLSSHAATPSDVTGTFDFVPIGNNDQNLADHFQVVAVEHYNLSGDIKFDYWRVYNNDPNGSIIAGIWCQGDRIAGQTATGGSGYLVDPSLANQNFLLPGGDSIGFTASRSFLAGSYVNGLFVPDPSKGIESGSWFYLYQDPGSPGLVEELNSGAFRLGLELWEPGGQTESFVSVPEPSSIALLSSFAIFALVVALPKRPLALRR